MRSILVYRCLLFGLLLLLSACSSVEAEPDAWSGTWRFDDATARLEVTLIQQGDHLEGSVERVIIADGTPYVTAYRLEARIANGRATGHLLTEGERLPLHLMRQESGLRVEVMVWSWIPVLRRAA